MNFSGIKLQNRGAHYTRVNMVHIHYYNYCFCYYLAREKVGLCLQVNLVELYQTYCTSLKGLTKDNILYCT